MATQSESLHLPNLASKENSVGRPCIATLTLIKASDMAAALSLANRTFIVTGANSGLGFETAKALARQDAHVIFAVKTKAKGDEAIRHIQQEAASKRAKLECMQVDLASFRLSNTRSTVITRLPLSIAHITGVHEV